MREVHAYGCGPFRAYYHPRFSRAISNNKQKNERFTPFFLFVSNLFYEGFYQFISWNFLFFVYLCFYINARGIWIGVV